jgi:Protein of unknown function DUF2834
MKRVYLVLAVAGFILPYYFLISFLTVNGLNLSLLIEQVFGTPGAAFFALDVIVTALAFWVFSYRETRRLQMSHWWGYVAATLLVGPSFALPLFLYFREGRIVDD